MFAARHLAPTEPTLARALRRRGRAVFPLRRRGAELGFAVPVARQWPTPSERRRRFAAAEPLFLPGALDDAPQRHTHAITASLRMFDRLRRGGSFLAELERRLADDPDLRYAGSTIDRDDPREVERVFVDAEPAGEKVAADLWAKLAWIAHDEDDRSLRIRFSSGLEQLEEWLGSSDATASWVDRFAARAFPECAAVLTAQRLRTVLDELWPRPHRLSERIVYNNAPNGGAVFHHDAEPGQLGVVFSQLEGRTAWLSIGKPRLAALLVRAGHARDLRTATAALDDIDARVAHWLNRDAAFTALLAAHGALFVLEAGDSIVLPSHSTEAVAWHSVIALGERPSLAHSYGVFPRQDDYPAVADPWLGRAVARARPGTRRAAGGAAGSGRR